MVHLDTHLGLNKCDVIFLENDILVGNHFGRSSSRPLVTWNFDEFTAPTIYRLPTGSRVRARVRV